MFRISEISSHRRLVAMSFCAPLLSGSTAFIKIATLFENSFSFGRCTIQRAQRWSSKVFICSVVRSRCKHKQIRFFDDFPYGHGKVCMRVFPLTFYSVFTEHKSLARHKYVRCIAGFASATKMRQVSQQITFRNFIAL